MKSFLRARSRSCGALTSFLLLGLWLFGGGSGAFAAEIIQSFDSDVRVAMDGELSVKETIQVRAEGRDIRHGIYRDFPLTFKDAGGTVREVDFKLLGVERDGKPEAYSTTREHGIIRIYAGNKDTTVSQGQHTYVFRYRTGRQIRWFDGKAELNWNVTGNFWRFPIMEASYHLQFVAGDGPVRWTAYTGRVGERGRNWQGNVGALGTLTVVTTRRLAPGEGLTVVAEIPANAVEAPTQNTLLWYEIFDNRRWIFCGFGLVLVLAYYLAAWNAVGRDPKRGIIIPLFQPPAGISPALANYIRDWGFGREKWRAFTAAALSLAVRGLLRFDDRDGTLTLTSTGKEPPVGANSLPAGEGAIFAWVKDRGGLARISKEYGESVAKVGENFTKSIEAENRNRFFRRNLGYVLAGLAMTVAVVVGVVVFGGLQDKDISILGGLAFVGFAAGIFGVQLVQSLFSGAGFDSVVRAIISVAFLAVLISILTSILQLASPSHLQDAVPAIWSYVENYPFAFVLVTAFTTINGLFFYLMRAPTALGRPIMDQLSGFRLYLETAESDRLNMQAPEITADRFETLLPYAVALDVEKPWSDAFAAALRRARPGEADPMNSYQPSWSSGGGWSGSNFGSAVSSSVASMSGALASAVPVSSGSSGFGGGGGSGGGGGGGGGGGW
jgi:Predicted membrane protein (DUF2207) C-terminal domain/Predicted membrane protein (DUF2207) N-terminal domain